MVDKEIQELTKEQQEAVLAILGDKVQSSSYIPIEVPTKCKWYETNEISIRPFTFEDEKEALNPLNKSKNFLNFMIERCIKGIDLDSLFLVDRNYITVKLKEISTGSNVTASIDCVSCARKSTLKIDLNILPVNSIDIELPIEVTLPEIKKLVKIMPPKVKDENFIISFDLLCKNLWRFVTEMEGVTDAEVINAVLDKLPINDVHYLLKTIGMTEFGVQSKVNYLCVCGKEQEVEVPITENFFGDSF